MARANGKKFKPMVVYRTAYQGIVYPEVNAFKNNDIVCCYQPKAWCDAKVLKHWINSVWKHVEPNKRKLLVIHNFRTHVDLKSQLEYNNIKVVYLPKNTIFIPILSQMKTFLV